MSTRASTSRYALPEGADACQIVAKLQTACDDPRLSAPLRNLLEQACDALYAATIEA